MSDLESAADLFGDEEGSRRNSPIPQKSPSPQLSHISNDEEQDVGDLVRQLLSTFGMSLISISLAMILKRMKPKDEDARPIRPHLVQDHLIL